MKEFKAGQRVYSPTEGTDILQVISSDDAMYPIEVGDKSFTECGMYHNTDHYPSIFHATKENQALLEALYGVKFDDPPLSDKEKVIEALKNANGRPVLCWVWDNLYDTWMIRAINLYIAGEGFYTHGTTVCYREAKPIAPDEFVLA